MAEGDYLIGTVHPVEGIVAPISCDVGIIRETHAENEVGDHG